MRTLASAPERSVGTRNVEGEPLLATTQITTVIACEVGRRRASRKPNLYGTATSGCQQPATMSRSSSVDGRILVQNPVFETIAT